MSSFRIGNITLSRPIALAPMEDVSDIPFRQICKERGADLVYTEFANCEAIIRRVKRSIQKVQVTDAERPVGIHHSASKVVTHDFDQPVPPVHCRSLAVARKA